MLIEAREQGSPTPTNRSLTACNQQRARSARDERKSFLMHLGDRVHWEAEGQHSRGKNGYSEYRVDQEATMKHETLRQHIEGVYETTFWGQPCTCDPKLIETVFGDGRRLIYYTPLATRPNYYIVRVGSDWDDDVYMDRLEEVYEAIEADFGNADDSQYDPETGHSLEEWEQLEWPAFHDGGGCYGFTDWPERVISKRRARKLKKRGEDNIWRIRGSNQYRWKPALFGASAPK